MTAQEILVKVVEEGYHKLPYCLIQNSDNMVSDQINWNDDDELKDEDFTSSKFWVCHIGDGKPIGFDTAEELAEIIHNEEESEFGTVTFKEEEYQLIEEPSETCRSLPGFTNIYDVPGGCSYNFEMAARAIKDGNKYNIKWIFEQVKGKEKELDSFDYDDIETAEQI
jgi:hypothetical protein